MMSDSSVSFRSVLRGYDPVQVDHHVNELAQSTAAIWHESAERTRQVNELTAENRQLRSELEGLAERARVLEEAQRESVEPTYTGLGERIGSVLTMVDKEVYELRTRAHADAANSLALADEAALATREEAEQYARETRGAADDEAAQTLEETRQQADSLLEDARQQAESLRDDARREAESLRDEADRQVMARQDADRQAMARREEAENLYEQARAKAAAAAVDFETTLAARREASALEFAAQVTAAEQQLAAVRLRSDQVRSDSERAQQEADAKIAQQLEQAMARSRTLVAEAKAKSERIRENSERELAAATQRRDSINAQLSDFRHELAELGGATKFHSKGQVAAAADQNGSDAVAGQEIAEAGQEATEGEADETTADGPAAGSNGQVTDRD